MTRSIAALFVDPRGSYVGLEGVDPWTPDRDARLYKGSDPVVAHPPCSRWCRLAGLVEARWGHAKGEDGGCFASALESVRRCGGVLEHPAWSLAWPAFDLNAPIAGGGWIAADFFGGWTCYVEQWRYGHPAKKATWLYACKVDLPELRWGFIHDSKSMGAIVERARPISMVSWCGNHVQSDDRRKRLTKKQASATPIEFRDILISIARSAR